MHQLMTLPHFIFLFYLFFSSSEFILNVLIDTIFARDMYQVYEINDDWLKGHTWSWSLCRDDVTWYGKPPQDILLDWKWMQFDLSIAKDAKLIAMVVPL